MSNTNRFGLSAILASTLLLQACGEQNSANVIGSDTATRVDEPASAPVGPGSALRIKVYTGNDNVETSRRLTAEEKRAILAGEILPPTTEIVCPSSVNMSNWDPEANHPGKDYGSVLIQRGGASFGYVTREWLNGCEQRLTSPWTLAEENGPHGEPQGDFKPTYSPDGKHIAFFRRYEGAREVGDVAAWQTRIAVINADGGGLRYLTKDLGQQMVMHCNPMWTRKQFPNANTGEAGYRVTWTRMTPPLLVSPRSLIPQRMDGCMNDVNNDGTTTEGKERCWTDVYPFQFAYSSLEDGRVIVRREVLNQLALVTPNETDGNQSVYEPITWGSLQETTSPISLIHKISISQDEKKITYMRVNPATPVDVALPRGYTNSQIGYADFDAKNRTISNEVLITKLDPNKRNWYPMFSRNSKQLIFACTGPCPIGDGNETENSTGQIYEYDMATKLIVRISHHLKDNEINTDKEFRQAGNKYAYPNVWGSVK